MIKSIKHTLLLAVALPLVFAGCNDLFDKGDTELAYEGPDVVGFKPLETEVQEGSSTTIEVQFISSEGVAQSDLSVSFSVDGSSTAAASTYSLSSTSVTIPSGSAAASFDVTFPTNGDIGSGDEVTLILNLDGGSGVEVAANLSTSTIFIQGVD